MSLCCPQCEAGSSECKCDGDKEDLVKCKICDKAIKFDELEAIDDTGATHIKCYAKSIEDSPESWEKLIGNYNRRHTISESLSEKSERP